jgi:uncharacterized protein DUF6894
MKGQHAMPLYFFHLSNSEEILPDEDGIELADAQAAREEAITAACELTDADSGDRERWSGWWINVADATGGHLLKVDIWPARRAAGETKRTCDAASC